MDLIQSLIGESQVFHAKAGIPKGLVLLKGAKKLVEKRSTNQDVVNSLKCGIQIEFKPSKKNWTLTLSVDESIGGSSILESLKV